MKLPCVLLRTEKKNTFAYQDGYKDVTTAELEALLELGRETIHSLEAELEARQISAKFEESTAVAECIGKLRKSMEHLKILGRLDEKSTKLVATAARILRAKPTNREGRLYQTFLCDIHRQCGREQVVLCAAGLGKQRVVCLNAQDRIRLVHFVKINTAVFASPILDALVEKCQIPNTNELFMQDNSRSQKRKISDVLGDDLPEEHDSRRIYREDERAIIPTMNKSMDLNDEQEAMGATNDRASPSEPEAGQHADAIPLERRIEYRYSEAPIDLISDLGETLTPAMQTSNQWKWERELRGSTTDCLNVLSPKSRNQDISITIVVGFKAGMQLVEQFQLSPR
ncbi:hypothetical protein DM02DRAFT_575900 [Periconia macrospinosa]|uniref:Uncharacterized protein n=1 Tax=Periconia macrospinosa TaxID=97972 RepID=A0A2V1D2U0_9PLEO|nr:hypothetical protein DM02DRAFT_575900 [Periconia macrospinosa]